MFGGQYASDLVKKRKPDHQLSMPIGSQRCDTKKGGECEKGHKDESRALFGKIWEGFKTICVLDCVCVCVHPCLGWVSCTVHYENFGIHVFPGPIRLVFLVRLCIPSKTW